MPGPHAPGSSAAGTAVADGPVATAVPAHVVHAVPAPLFTRGTVLVVPGRGENAAVYTRLAARLTVDAYRVVVVDGDRADVPALTALIGELTAAPDDSGSSPLAAVGSDVGAITVHDLAAQGTSGLAGVALAGLPVRHPVEPHAVETHAVETHAVETQAVEPHAGSDLAAWHDELDARTACPVHRERLDGDPRLARGALLREAVPTWTARRPRVPALVLHGAADVISPLRLLLPHLRGAVDEVTVVDNGRHDVLNDLHHRSVAGRLVQFLEALRRDPLARPVLSEVTP